MQDFPEYTTPQVAAHNSRDDLWIVIHGKVYDITSYVSDHPGGADVLLESAGTDATEAYEDVGHSEDADEILRTYLIGTLRDARKQVRPQAVRIIQPPSTAAPTNPASKLKSLAPLGGAVVSLYFCRRINTTLHLSWLGSLDQLQQWPRAIPTPSGFYMGFSAATVISTVIGSLVARKLSAITQIASGFTRYPPHVKSRRGPRRNPHLVKGFLDPKEYKSLPLIQKEALSLSVYKFVFQLPTPQTVIGLPIGQHVAIKGEIDGAVVSRSYTPTSNNLDRGVLELVIKCYPDGLLTGRYLANLQIGEQVQFRGPKGAMNYTKGLCKKIGMVAGGTGITPMYQVIRAICEDETDLTEVSLIYANRTEEDILLREGLERFARAYPRNLKLWYMLDVPPENWTFGTGYVTAEIMKERFPPSSPDTKIMLCGPPGMVNASKKALVSLGYQAPGAVAKMADQIFCF
ncbi:hypothetical protein BJX65DRAFT_320427 [Aspergillus insuetus]